MIGHFSVSYLLTVFPAFQSYFPPIRYHPAARGSHHIAPSLCQVAGEQQPLPQHQQTQKLSASPAALWAPVRPLMTSELTLILSFKLKGKDFGLGGLFLVRGMAQRAFK